MKKKSKYKIQIFRREIDFKIKNRGNVRKKGRKRKKQQRKENFNQTKGIKRPKWSFSSVLQLNSLSNANTMGFLTKNSSYLLGKSWLEFLWKCIFHVKVNFLISTCASARHLDHMNIEIAISDKGTIVQLIYLSPERFFRDTNF